MAAAISSSSTVTISSTYRSITGSVRSPARRTAIPSAIVVAASTGGASPALARRLREELDAYLTDDFEPLTELLAEVRRELRERRITLDAETWQQAIDGQLRVLLAQRRHGQAKAYLLRGLGLLAEPAGLPRTGDEPIAAAAHG